MTTGSSPPPKSPSPISIATRFSTRRACPSRSPPTRRASAPKPALPAKTRAASSASTSSKRSSWSSSRGPRNPTPQHERLTRDAEEILEALGPALSPRPALHRRHRLLLRQDLRPRSLAARARISTAKSLPAPTSTPSRRAAPTSATGRRRAGRQGQARVCAHSQRQRPGRGPHLAGDPRKLPAGRRLCAHS